MSSSLILLILEYSLFVVVIIERAIKKYDGLIKTEEEFEEDEAEKEGEALIPPTVSSSILHGSRLQEAVVINCDGLFCPMCYEAWTSVGDHRICCLPCGHIYGLSCIKRWLQRSLSSGKCPQCEELCPLKDIRVLYAPGLCLADEELRKRVRSLEARCFNLDKKAATPKKLIDKIPTIPTVVRRLATALVDAIHSSVKN